LKARCRGGEVRGGDGSAH